MSISPLAPIVARVTALALAASGLALVAASPTTAAPASFTNTKRFSDTSSTEWTVPPGVTSIDFVAIGGRGLRSASGVSGGLGLKLAGTMAVTPGQTLYVTTAGNGDNGGAGAGYNGGGAGGAGDSLNGRGGGASDIRLGGNELTDRVLVAGGGGGAAPGQYGGRGGGGNAGLAGTGQSGKPGDTNACTNPATAALGGSQTAGGAAGDATNNQCVLEYFSLPSLGSPGTLGLGGTGHVPSRGTNLGAGGGGGLYGGGGGASQGGGGGGSSYYDPSVFTITTNETTTEYSTVAFTYQTLAGSLTIDQGYSDLAADGKSFHNLSMNLRDQAGTHIAGQELTLTSDVPGVTFGPVGEGGDYYSVRVTAGFTAGVVTVTASAAGVSGSTTFTIVKGSVPVAFTSAPTANRLVGDSYWVTASGSSPQTPVTFTAGSASCTVSDARNGSALVTFTHVGTCVIGATRGDDPNLLTPTPIAQSVPVYRGQQGRLAFAGTAKKPVVGTRYQARTRGSAPGLPVRFTTQSKRVCTVNSTGLVKFRKAGSCVLSATQPGNADYYQSNTAVKVIKVKKKSKKKSTKK
ncbi:MAG: glycine-rich protein [Aeromicrobium sp.]